MHPQVPEPSALPRQLQTPAPENDSQQFRPHAPPDAVEASRPSRPIATACASHQPPSPFEAPLTRRSLLAAASLGSVASVLGGCGSGGTGSAAQTTSLPAGTSAVQGTVGPLGQVVQANLEQVKATVSAIADPITGTPPVIPDYDALFAAAGRLDASVHPAQSVATIAQLLGRAVDVGNDAPSPTYPLAFPRDHAFHPTMGLEWYYICLHLRVTDGAGTPGRIGVMAILDKQRVVGLSIAQRFGWTDIASTVFASMVTATVDMPAGKSITRRSTNVQWPAAGGSASFSAPGEPLGFTCGRDSLRGSLDVLPLAMTIDDSTNLAMALTLLPAPGLTAPNAFFLQGIPDALTAGTGLTPVPTPGIYYSWPQVQVDTSASPTITVDGRMYTITGGTGWIDHQLLMQSIENPAGATSPIPFTDDRRPYSGWCWQFFNLENGDAFTGSAFENWYISTTPQISYGYYVTPNAGRWTSLYISGDLALSGFQGFRAIPGDASSPIVRIPSTRTYSNVKSILGLGTALQGTATPWLAEGTFNFPGLQTVNETPADYVDTSGVKGRNGLGYCESVGFESDDSYRARALLFLQG